MITAWSDVVARTRGLSTHLISGPQLSELAKAPGLPELATELAALGLVPSTARDVPALEQALRRERARRLALLANRCGPRVAILDVLFLDEDRRSLVSLLRTIAAAGDPSAALLGLIPTPALPERALAALAALSPPRAVAAQLAAWGHPMGSSLLAAASQPEAGLSALERALHQAWAVRARRAARWADAPLRAHVRDTIDIDNVLSVLVGLRQPRAARAADAWLPGGARLDATTYAKVLDAGTEDRALALLRATFSGTPPHRPLLGYRPGSGRIELELLAARIEDQARSARVAPLGTAPIVQFALRLRAEAIDLRGVLWGVALGIPGAAIDAARVTR